MGGRPLVAWSLIALAECDLVDGIVLAAPPGQETTMRMAIGDAGGEGLVVVSGGSTRQRSVAAALAAVPDEVTEILVHDAARPLITPQLVETVLEGLPDVEGAIAAAPLADTLKRGDSDQIIQGTLDRTGLWQAQTPQAFHADVLRRAFELADEETLETATDCASMVEALGGRVRLVAWGSPNLKVTTPADLEQAETLLLPYD